MPYFREEDQKRKRTPEGIERAWSDEAHSVLVLAIQTIDILPPVPGPHRDVTGYTYQEQLEELRQRLDLILNSEHWKEKYYENK